MCVYAMNVDISIKFDYRLVHRPLTAFQCFYIVYNIAELETKMMKYENLGMDLGQGD